MEEVSVAIPSISRTNDHGAPLRAPVFDRFLPAEFRSSDLRIRFKHLVPGGVRGVGWGLQPRGASIEPDEVVQMALGQLREYFAGQRQSHLASRPTSDGNQLAGRSSPTGTRRAEWNRSARRGRSGRSWRPTQSRSLSRATAWSPAMDSVDIPAASPVGIWRLRAGCQRT